MSDVNYNKLFIGNIDWDTSEKELRDLFSQLAEVTDCIIVTDKETGKSRGFGFVTVSSSAAAENIIGELNGAELHGRRIRISIALPRQDKTKDSYISEKNRRASNRNM